MLAYLGKAATFNIGRESLLYVGLGFDGDGHHDWIITEGLEAVATPAYGSYIFYIAL